MTNSIIFKNNLKRVISSFIFLVVLLTAANVLAATRVLPVYGTMQVNDKGCNVTVNQAADPCKAVKRERSTNNASSNSRPDNARRVFSDDYQHTLRAVTQPRKREMLWLSK